MSQQRLSPETLESIFCHLKPYCIELLNLMKTPKKSAPFLLDMAELLRQAPPQALQPSLDYTMFPLLLLLDAAIKCRVGVKADDLIGGFEISDFVAEGVLLCIEQLLIKCHIGSVNQMVVVLKKLNTGAMLTPDEASEKFREAIIRCLRAMLFRIKPCSLSLCTCKDITSLAIINSLEVEYSACMKFDTEPQECLLAFLRSQDAAAAIGHWMSLLLQIAETEVGRGHRGSTSLRKEALLTIRVLIAKIGTADALAFFLPGIVSRFSKALHLTKTMISGAAGSSSCTEHTLHGLSEFLMIVLNDKANHSSLESSMELSKVESAQSILQALRSLPIHKDEKSDAIPVYKTDSDPPYEKTKSLYVARTKEWIDKTSENVDKLLSASFPHLAIHPSEKVRKGLVESTRGLLTNCCCTLKKSKLMLLECLCVLICDDSALVSVAAHQSVKSLFMLGTKFLNQDEISDLFSRLIEGLPRVVFGNEENTAISHARKLLALMYYAGPELVVEHLLSSPVKSSRFLEFLMLSLSHNSQFMGPIDKLILSKPLSVGYLLSVAELKAGTLTSNRNYSDGSITQPVYEMSNVNDKNRQMFVDNIESEYELPSMPPWFVNIGSKKLYFAIAGILRLSGLSVMAGRSSVSLSVLIDILLANFHKLISELRIRDYKKEGWQEWYIGRGSGQLLRQTSAAICILNEIVYGLSDQSVHLYSQLFACSDSEGNGFSLDTLAWKVREGKEARDQIIYCIGSILHEYLSPEVWDLPEDQNSPSLQIGSEVQPSLHFFRDTTMLHQVIIEGIGIFSMVLGKDFVSNGFMHSTLYLLLQKLICSSSQIKIASDTVLRMLSSSTGYPSVGHLVVANADYIIDSLCRQLRHLDINPQTPDVFAAMLSYVGTAHEILPLLEEPMRAVSSELEVLRRHQHPHLTVPFLKAVSEIAKASRLESSKLPCKAEAFSGHVDAEVSIIHETGNCHATNLEQLEELLLKLNEMRRYRRIVGSLALSCLKAAVPFLSSLKESSCLLALNTIEDVTLSIVKVEEAYKYEKRTKISIEKAQLSSFSDLQDSMDCVDDEADENRLLPAMNTVWPYLIICIKNKVSVAVITKCTCVISNTVQLSGGDFFIRRFHNDGPIIWKLLSTSPFQRKVTTSKNQKQIMLLPYRNTQSTENPMAEMSSLKIQMSILNMIAELSSNKKSASAIAGVIKKVSGLVVGIACSSVIGLRECSINALYGLACIDSDLIWLLIADVYYSVKSKDRTHPQPPAVDLPELSRVLPKPASAKDYLYVQHGGESSGFDIDVSAVEIVFQKVQSWQFI